MYEIGVPSLGNEEIMFKHKVTTALIEGYLDRHGWNFHHSVPEVGEREGLVVTNWSSTMSDGSSQLVIDPMVEKMALRFRVPQIVHAPPDETPAHRLNDLLLAMSALNDRFNLGAFVYNPSTGDVAFSLGIPIARDELEYEDFEHALTAVVVTTDRYSADLRAIIDGTKTAAEVIG